MITGWDSVCCEDKEWIEVAGAGGLEKGLKQPFYHVLVDVRDWEFDAAAPPVAYIAQELLMAPEREDEGKSWVEVSGCVC